MRTLYQYLCFLLLAGLLLSLCSCADIPGESASLDEKAVTITASFQQEDGTALCGGTVRLSRGEDSMTRTLDDSGEAQLSSLPRSGTFALTVLDGQEQSQGTMFLTFTEGAVIDATTDDSGNGHVTLRKDTEEVALAFHLQNDGTIQCALRLDEADSPGAAQGVI